MESFQFHVVVDLRAYASSVAFREFFSEPIDSGIFTALSSLRFRELGLTWRFIHNELNLGKVRVKDQILF